MIVTKAKRFISILLINVVIILIGILICELIFGNWINQDNLNKLNIIKDKRIRFKISDLYESPHKTATYTRDKYGLRGQFEHPSEILILTVGGSTTDQRYITDGETWQDVLKQEFETVEKNIVVANAGVDSQSTFGHIKNFDWWFPNIPGLKPKYVLFYIGLNDFYKEEGSGYDALIDDNSFRNLLRERSAIYHLVRTLYGVYQAELEQNIGHRSIDFKKQEWVSEPLLSSYDKIMDTRLKEYAERLEMLIQKTESFGSTPIFMTSPSRMYRLREGRIEGVKAFGSYKGAPINGVDYYYLMMKLDHVTCSTAKEHNILCLDLAKEMIQEWEEDDFYDFAHMTPKGARKVGQYIFEILREKL